MARRKVPDDEVPLPRGKIVVPAKKVVTKRKKPPAKGKLPPKVDKKATPPSTDALIDDFDDDEDGGGGPGIHMPAPQMDGYRQDNQRSLEFATQMRARLTNEPVFPFPPELHSELKPYWVELVNSFPKTHFQISDITMMKMYCQCAYDIDRQNELIREEGEVVMGARAPITNPRCKVRESNRSTLMALATKFRNQPASRMNTDNFKRRKQRAAEAAQGADAVMHDEDGLLAGGDGNFDMDDDDQQTRH